MQQPWLQPQEHAALSAVLGYWEQRWDWECPTLFGLELQDYRAAMASWRESFDLSRPAVALALSGALREFLYGASAVKEDYISGITNMQKSEIEDLASRVSPYILEVAESQCPA